MILKSMTATFGRLDGDTLELREGLNLISAPNEWGKSTWCAFLMAMLYGIDTSQRASKGVLPDKERYKPWSGKPMEGRIDLDWNGRAISIQRTTRGRVPMGEFRAYETDSGQNVPELTKDNCGLMLLGVERSVFQRSGFIRQSELPVTQDEALSRRLNALVTTGNENAAGFQLEKQLRDLQNRCRHNKTGLLPQAEGELSAVSERLSQLDQLNQTRARLESQLADLRGTEAALIRHEEALAARDAAEKRQALEQARAEEAQAKAQAEELYAHCQTLPEQSAADLAQRELRALSGEMAAWNVDAALLPPPAEPPAVPPALAGEEAPMEKARRDAARYHRLCDAKPRNKTPFLLIFLLLLAAGAGLWFVTPWAACAAWVVALGVLAFGLISAGKQGKTYESAQEEMQEILDSYGVSSPDDIVSTGERCAEALEAYRRENARQAESRQNLEAARAALTEKVKTLSAPYDSPAAALDYWESVSAAWDQWGDAQRAYRSAREHTSALERLAGELPEAAVDASDDLDLSLRETQASLRENRQTQARLRSQLDQCQGKGEALGDPARLSAQAEALTRRIGELEDYYAALGYAQAALKAATNDLRRRFAPKITAQAREILRQLTGGRYDKLLLEEDFSLSAGTQEETALTAALRRSDGTMDQMYLALRLAVCREVLGPNVPIVLDDALVRFDDARLSAALGLLTREAETRQILLFTCQGREAAILNA